jgi:hypothetical protein
VSYTADDVLAVEDISRELVDVPEWGFTFEVRSMTAAERTHIMDLAQKAGEVDLSLVYPEVVIATTYNPDTGDKVFTSDHRVALMAKNAAALDRLAKAGMRLSGMTEEAADAAGKDSSQTDTDEPFLS